MSTQLYVLSDVGVSRSASVVLRGHRPTVFVPHQTVQSIAMGPLIQKPSPTVRWNT